MCAMIPADPQDLAFSLVRFHGVVEAFSLANRYAERCATNSDHLGHAKWKGAAVVIGALIKADQREDHQGGPQIYQNFHDGKPEKHRSC
jgi:hypothetical protein